MFDCTVKPLEQNALCSMHNNVKV